MKEIIYYIIAILFVGSIFGSIAIFFIRKKINYRRTLELCFLRITMPKKDSDLDEKKETTKDFKEMIGLMDQLLSSLKSIYSRKIIKKILGQDLISLEYIAHENHTFFYFVIPKNYKLLIEKQITGFYNDAVIEETKEVNIFKGKKYVDGRYINTSKGFFLPIKTYQKLESDPINNILNSISKLGETDSGAIQVLLKPIDDDWQDACSKKSSEIINSKKSRFSLNPLSWIIEIIDLFANVEESKNPMEKDNSNSALTQERGKTVDEKGDKTGFEVIIRIVVASNERQNLESEIINISSSFSQFNYPDFNKMSPCIYYNKDKLIRNYILRYFKKPIHLKRMILNTEEIASVFHLPHIKYNKNAEVKWQNFKIVKAPNEVPKEGLLLGYNFYRGVKKEIRIKTEDRFRHFYVIGQTGTGKSSILQVMARQDLKNGEGICVIDPHGDLARDLLPFIPRERADDVIFFDPSDLERPIGLNILEAPSGTEEEKEMVALDAMNIMIKLFGNEIFGPRLQDYFRNAALTLLDYPGGGAITDVVRMFVDQGFRDERVRTLKNPIVRLWWEKTYASMGDREKSEIIPFFQAKFAGFTTNKMMRNIIGQVKSSFDIGKVMQEKKILVVNLSKGRLGDFNSKLLGMILVSKIQMGAMQRDKISKDERKDFYLYIDEFQNYVTDSIESILSEARKYRLSLNIAHQYLAQLEHSDALTKSSLNLKNAIFGNVGSIMSYKIGPEDGEFMEKYYAPVFSGQDLINMDKFKSVMKLSVDNQPTTPFSIIPVNPYLQEGSKDLAKAFIELSRLKHGRDASFVSKEIEYRIGS